MVKISVILPIYNVEKFLPQCLESLIKQTLTDIEIICINDGSTDGSQEVIDKYAKNYKSIINIKQENKGVSAARNLGLKLAHGEYITFVDPDDFLVHDGLDLLYREAVSQKADIVHGLFSVCEENGKNIRPWWNNDAYRSLLDVVKSGTEFIEKLFEMESTACNGVYSRRFLKQCEINFPEEIFCSEDMVWTYAHHLYAKRITAIDFEYYIYRLHNKSQTHKRNDKNCTLFDAVYLFEDKYYYKFANWDKENKWEKRKFTLFKWAFRELIPYKRIPLIAVKVFKKLSYNSKKRFIKKFFYKIWYYIKSGFIIKKIFGDKHSRINILELRCSEFGQKIDKLRGENEFFKRKIYLYDKRVNEINSYKKDVEQYINNINIENAILKTQQKANRILIETIRENFINYIQNDQLKKRINNPLNFDNILNKSNDLKVIGNLNHWAIENRNKNLPILFHNTSRFVTMESGMDTVYEADIAYLWGFWDYDKILTMLSISNRFPFFYIEDAFIKSILTSPVNGDSKYHSGIGFNIDDLTFYFDATRPSRLECMLNSEKLNITIEQKKRANSLMAYITKNYLTKYNYQPIYNFTIGRENVKKILVVDQVVGDYSIKKGMADDNTFSQMLNDAINENKEADIIVKTHPDTIAKRDKTAGYYASLKNHGNVYILRDNINPIALLKKIDLVYVCTSQLGFEALMCGKEVHVYGMPFYAGWGLTIDQKNCVRRTRQRSLEEVFYITYILYSRYVDPVSKSYCEIEYALDYLLGLRNEYFAKYDVLFEN